VKYRNACDFTILDGEYSVWKRPFYGVLNVLHKIANLYVYTASDQEYADPILDKMYPRGVHGAHRDMFKKRLYREDCTDDGKNLLLIVETDEDLKNTILVDDKLHNNYSDDQQFYHIPPYEISKCDIELLRLFVHIVWIYVKR
jgi:TFIIF-interacting CTD phosphatase-like protein